uniref:Uncharacterized protein n=1 Tax=Anopheles dirus TaxID=7168 RepID=A0A182NWQ7_9DIPT
MKGGVEGVLTEHVSRQSEQIVCFPDHPIPYRSHHKYPFHW